LVVSRICRAHKQNGEQCRVAALRDADVCFWHSPEHAEEAAEARRLGGLRRRREGAVAGAYDIEGLETIPQIRRLLEIAVLDGLALDNSVPRVRVIIAGALAAAKLLEVGDLEGRLDEVEAVLKLRGRKKR
jgi:hypothetical protein